MAVMAHMHGLHATHTLLHEPLHLMHVCRHEFHGRGVDAACGFAIAQCCAPPPLLTNMLHELQVSMEVAMSYTAPQLKELLRAQGMRVGGNKVLYSQTQLAHTCDVPIECCK